MSSRKPLARKEPPPYTAYLLCGLSLFNYLLMYAVGIVLARHLTVEAFDDYNVGVSVVSLLAVLTPLGMEKAALAVLPSLHSRGSLAAAHGFWRFSILASVVVGVFLAFLFAATLETTLMVQRATTHITIVILVSCLPVIAIGLLMVEVATAYGAGLRATAVYRGLIPLLILAFNLVFFFSPLNHSGYSAAFCYGAAWFVGAAVCLALARRVTPKDVWKTQPQYQVSDWLLTSAPLLIGSLLLTAIAQSGILILEVEFPSKPVVSLFAVAVQTGTFVVLAATSTNRFYLPELAIALEKRDRKQIRRIYFRRLRMILPLTASFLACIVIFGQDLLLVFGEQYRSAYSALLVISFGAAVGTVFSMSPYHLQFTNRNRQVLIALLIALLINLGLGVYLTTKYAALGAAIAYAMPIAGVYAFFGLYTLLRPLAPTANEAS